ncbi:MAG: hypothetical protein A3J83_03695 [Elusimicrobia bacterium RIFOXYA2_FULL_40_6]|nr:MAG: hypothetical protein A3J83_03695 [Elusimicrobia bacterium RIFOXYA2_FULL_40_6]
MSKFTFEEVKKALKLDEKSEIWEKDWELSEESFKFGELYFLEENYVGKSCDEIKMKPEIKKLILDYLPVFKSNIALQRLIWHCHYITFVIAKAKKPDIAAWPTEPLDEGMFFPLFFLSGIDFIKKHNAKLGISEEITIDSLVDLELWIIVYKEVTGKWGLRQKHWVANAFLGHIYKLGRLQFKFDPFFIDLNVYRNKKDRRIIVFPYDGIEFRKDGQFNGADKIRETEGIWKSKLEIKDGFIYGNFISPTGIATPEIKKIMQSEWDLILKRDSRCLSVHIPATGPMDFAQCGESFRRAIEFFPKYFPEYNYEGFFCDSWLLDPQLEQYLPAESNVIKFMKEFYNVPVPDAENTVFFRVFGKEQLDVKTAPRDTSLRRSIIKHVENGGRWRDTAFVYFAEDFNWGSQFYRKMWGM